MFNLGLPEIIILGVVALLLFGPKRLPELAKGFGKGLRDFKKAIAGEFDEKQEPKEIDNVRELEPPPVLKARKPAKKKKRA